MLILGIDPGSNATGYGLIQSRAGRLRAVDFGTITPPRGLLFYDRLPYLFTALESLVARTRPDQSAIEDLFHARNSQVALKLGHVRGIVLLAMQRGGVPIHQYAPRLVKQAVGGYGGGGEGIAAPDGPPPARRAVGSDGARRLGRARRRHLSCPLRTPCPTRTTGPRLSIPLHREDDESAPRR